MCNPKRVEATLTDYYTLYQSMDTPSIPTSYLSQGHQKRETFYRCIFTMTSFYEYSKTCTIHEFAIQLVLYFTPITSVNMVLPHPNASTTGVDPPLVCLLCGMEVPATYDSGIANIYEHDQILKHGQWKGIWKSNLDHVMVPSHETEDAYFSDLPRLWACFCRVSKFSTRGIRSNLPRFSN